MTGSSIVAFMAYVVTATATPATGATVRAIRHYELAVPAGYTLRSKVPQGRDFDVYEIGRADDIAPTLVLYVGANPGFPRLKWLSAAEVQKGAGKVVSKYSYSAESEQLEGLINFDGLTYKRLPDSPFSSIHYFATGVREREAKVFERIIESIRVSKRHLD